MIQVTVGSNLNQKTVLYPEDTTVEEILMENHIPLDRSVHIDGSPVTDITMSLSGLGVTESCFIISVAKANNA